MSDSRHLDICVGASDSADALLQLIDGGEVLQSIAFAPDAADSVAEELRKFAALSRAKRQGAAGSA